jgi:AcrR family transcriptional regulator
MSESGTAKWSRPVEMARDATDTREVLLRTARRMFASDGIYQVPLKRIIESAGQRNASALHYHFGGRDGLLIAITERHDDAIEHERAAMLERLRADARLDDVRSLVEALVIPFAHELTTDDGREYLRIVEQLVGLFDLWDIEVATGPTGAQRVFHYIEQQLGDLDPAVRHERITLFLSMVTEALATRARRLDSDRAPALDHDAFVCNLVDMCVGALQAPSTPFGTDPASG